MNRETEIRKNNNLLIQFVQMAFEEDRQKSIKDGEEKHYLLPDKYKDSFQWLLYTLGVDNSEKVTVNYIINMKGQELKWYYDGKEIKPQCNNIVLRDLNSQIWQLLVLCSMNDSNLIELS